MKRAIVTLTCGNMYERMAALTHPAIKAYADRLGADFLVWNSYQGHTIPDYQKLELGKLLEKYERVLYLDTDILVRDDAPDIFDMVPEDCVGMMHEGQYLPPYERLAPTIDLMTTLGFDPNQWDGRYFNAGVIVLSRAHRNLFVQPDVEWDNFAAQTYINILLAQSGTKVFSLPHRFNRIHFMDAAYGEERFDSYFLHYAGLSTELSGDDLLALMARDQQTWKLSRPAYRFQKHIAYIAEGDLGQQIAAEPAVRYAREVLHREDELVVVSKWPEIFGHLGVPMYRHIDDVPRLEAFCCRYSLRDPSHTSRAQVSSNSVNCVNFVSWQLLGMELPLDAKTPRLAVDPTALATLADKTAGLDPARLVLVHPANTSTADTFPAAVWQEFVDILVESGLSVAVIGSGAGGDLPIVEFDRSRLLDLTDRLSFGEIIALVSQAPVLVCGLSPLVHVAGAFDHWIGLISPSKHPDYVLHWRNGSQYWHVRTLQLNPRYPGAGRALPDEQHLQPDRLREFLPTAQDLLSFVRTCAGDNCGMSQRNSMGTQG